MDIEIGKCEDMIFDAYMDSQRSKKTGKFDALMTDIIVMHQLGIKWATIATYMNDTLGLTKEDALNERKLQYLSSKWRKAGMINMEEVEIGESELLTFIRSHTDY